jgi:hypothetical protein
MGEGLINTIVTETLGKLYIYLNSFMPESFKPFIALGFGMILITLYGIFVWKFYRFLARRDLLDLNLKQYNRVDHPGLNKFFAFLLFIIEYIVILPIVVFFWFFVIAVLLFLMAKELSPGNILLIAGSIVGAVRIASYYEEDLSRDLAKLFPFTILAIALVTPGFFNFGELISKLEDLGDLIPNLLIYLVAIMVIEFILRLVYIISPDENVTF